MSFVALSAVASADSIIVKGKHYEDVYVRMGTDVYYIQNPADGSMVEVPKDQVREKDIAITPDREARRQMQYEWQQKRRNKSSSSSTLPDAASSKPAPLPTAAPAKAPAPEAKPLPATAKSKSKPSATEGAAVAAKTLPASAEVTPVKSSNIINDVANEKRDIGAVIGNIPVRSKSRDIFMDAKGTPVLTNMPEDFRNRPEYVEVTLHFETIKVPEQFRNASWQQPTKTPLGKKVDATNSVDEIVKYYSRQYALDEALVFAIIKAESNGNRFAVSPAGARGLMQLMPGTARDMGVKDIFDPAENIAGGTQYLAKLLTLFDNNQQLAIAGYNAGPGNVQKYGGIPPFPETQDYVRRVKLYQREMAHKKGIRLAMDSSQPVDQDYLPPESKDYYMIVLDNGLTVAAEQVYPDGDRYVYTFKGRSGHFEQSAVARIIEPA